MMEFIEVSETDGIAIIALNRPEKRNAMHGPLISEFLAALKILAGKKPRVLLIHGKGENFCAGGDIAWMQKIAEGPQDKNYDDAQLLADLLYQLYVFPTPTIVLAQGAVLGGGMGLAAAADMVVASREASFGFPEVKIGLAPSIVSPYIIAAIGARQARYYFLTGEKFGAEKALHLGLIHQITEEEALMSTGISLAHTLMQNRPHALFAAKQLIAYVASEKINEDLAQKTAQHLAELRITPEAQAGLKAFIEKSRLK